MDGEQEGSFGEIGDFSAAGQPGLTPERAGKLVQALTMTNLDEMLPDDLEIVFREWETVNEKDARGVERPHKRSYKRTAHISTFVPMINFLQMIKGQQAQAQSLSKSSPDATMAWMQTQVLNVWKLSEEDMTLERLGMGLAGEKMLELFFTFFGGMLSAAPRIKALLGDMPNSSSAPRA